MKLKLPKRHRECPHCAREAQIDSSRGAYMDWLLRQITAAGWAVSGVADDALGPPWAFSVGLWANVGQADLAVFGRPVQQLRAIINCLAERVSGPREAVLSVGDELDDVCRSRLAVRPVHVSWRETI